MVSFIDVVLLILSELFSLNMSWWDLKPITINVPIVAPSTPKCKAAPLISLILVKNAYFQNATP